MAAAYLWTILALLTATDVAEAQPPLPQPAQCPADADLAHLVAASNLILVGTAHITLDQLPPQTPRYVDIPVDQTLALRGEAPETLILRVYSEDRPYAPSRTDLIGSGGAPALFFLQRVDEPAGFYFAGYSPSAFRSASDASIAAVVAEVSRQDEIGRTWRPGESAPHFAAVRDLVAQLGSVRGAYQQAVFNQLAALGPSAVPAIVALMDDRRALADRRMALANPAGAFEGVRHYAPQQVVDALDAILNQMTGQGFGSIANGGSDLQRTAVVSAWRVYAADLSC